MDDNAIDILLRLQDELSPALAKAQAMIRQTAADAALTGGTGAASFKGFEDSVSSWLLIITGGVAAGDLLASSIKAIAGEALDLAKALPEIALRGATVDEVTQGFERLTESMHRSADTLLGALRESTHGTISDFDLMKRANEDLATGLNLTDDQFNLLGKGALALAQVTGGSVKDALDTMNDALVTGRARAVALLTGKIDLKAAEEAYATAAGHTIDQMTAEQKLEVDRQAILAGVERAVGRIGVQTDGLLEKTEQGEAAWRNYIDQLGQAIATSPVLMKALDGIADVMTAAFGNDRAKSIKGIVEAVDELIVEFIDLGLAGLQTANVVVTGWDAVKMVVLGLETVIVGLIDVLGEVYLAADKVALKLHLVDPGETAAIQANVEAMRAMTVGLAVQTAEAARGVAGQDAFHQALDRVGGALFVLRDKLDAAASAHQASGGAVDKNRAAHEAFAGPLQQTTDGFKLSAAEVKRYADAWAQLATIGETVRDTVGGIQPELRAQIQYFLDAGAFEANVDRDDARSRAVGAALEDHVKLLRVCVATLENLLGDALIRSAE